jgi:hypothetical protein
MGGDVGFCPFLLLFCDYAIDDLPKSFYGSYDILYWKWIEGVDEP